MNTTAAKAISGLVEGVALTEATLAANTVAVAVKVAAKAQSTYALSAEKAMELALPLTEAVVKWLASTGVDRATFSDFLNTPAGREQVGAVVWEKGVLVSRAEYERNRHLEAEAKAGITRSGYQIGGRNVDTREHG